MKYSDSHGLMKRDIFGMTGSGNFPVKLRLSFRAYLLLREEFPESIPYMVEESDENHTYLLEVKVTAYAGVGRFTLGLIDQVEVLGSDEFKAYLDSIIAKW